jgi:hypothetical protein
VAQLGENNSAYRIVVGKLKETGGFNDLGPRHRKNTTKWILHTKDGCGMNLSDRIGSSGEIFGTW